MFLLIGADGEKIIVDTGFSVDYIPGLNSTYNRKPEEELANKLIENKVYPDEIKTVIQTHLHWDHAGAISLFPKANIYVQTLELAGLLDVGPYEECSFNTKYWLPYLDKFILIEGNKKIRKGLNLIYTGHHTKGHQVVKVATKSGTVILAGDVPFVYDTLWESIPEEYWHKYRSIAPEYFWQNNIRPTIQAKLIKERKTISEITPISFKELKTKANIFLPTHDPRLHKIEVL